MPTSTGEPPRDPGRELPREGIELIKVFEGCPDGDPATPGIDAYLDPVGIWTIGWGHAIPWRGGFLRGSEHAATARSLYPGGLTVAQAEALLRDDVGATAERVRRLAPATIDDGAYGALLSFAFNVGCGALERSTLLKRLKAGDRQAAADQFLAWDKARVGSVLTALPGLTRRRRAERALFVGADWRTAAGLRATTRGGRAPRIEPEARVRPETPAEDAADAGDRANPL